MRYPTIKAEMAPILDQLRDFLAAQNLGEIRTNQWEVTYVNHLPRGTVWNTPADWSRVFTSSVCLPQEVPSAAMEGFNAEWHYTIEGNLGRLHVQLQHAWREVRDTPKQEPKQQELLIFKLTARGPIPEGPRSLESGPDLGRSVIVNTFREVASEDARRYWEELR